LADFYFGVDVAAAEMKNAAASLILSPLPLAPPLQNKIDCTPFIAATMSG
jgi:hypothetical protein